MPPCRVCHYTYEQPCLPSLRQRISLARYTRTLTRPDDSPHHLSNVATPCQSYFARSETSSRHVSKSAINENLARRVLSCQYYDEVGRYSGLIFVVGK